MLPGGPPLVLASGSAARRSLLAAAGLVFTVQPAAVDEAGLKAALRARGVAIGDAAMALADAKAAALPGTDALVIAADQMLGCGDEWFDKPGDLASARTQLLRLRGRPHRLHAAVTCWRAGARLWGHLAVATLTMRAFSEPFLDAYLGAEGNAVLGCVGAYRLEGPGIQLFETVEGDHSAILGLPMLPLLAFLRQAGVIAA
jgi:septum formation protein